MEAEEIGKVGQEAARLMDDLVEDLGLPDNAEVKHVGLVVEMRVPDGDEEHIAIRCSSDSRLTQIGLFSSAATIAYVGRGVVYFPRAMV